MNSLRLNFRSFRPLVRGRLLLGCRFALVIALCAFVVHVGAASDSAISITTQPAAYYGASGQSFTLTVAATAPGALTYQWRRNGVALPGATLSTFTHSAATRADSDHYDVVVRSGSESVVSQSALVVVHATSFPGLVGVDASFKAAVEADDAWVNKILVTPDGRIYVAGEFVRFNGVRTSGVARLKADLTIDPSFVAPLFEGEVTDIALQSDGKVVAVGRFWRVAGQEGPYVTRLNSDGSHDPTFVFDAVSAVIGSCGAVAIQSDGRILIGGGSRVIRVDSNGARELTFDALISSACTIVPLSDGKILVAGWASSFDGSYRSQVTRLQADGSRDPSFVVPAGVNDPIATMFRQADGKILIGGSFTTFGGVPVPPIVRLNADGTRDASFGAGESRYTGNTVESIAVAGDGKILIGGWNYPLAGMGFARLTSDGALDTLFSGPVSRRPGRVEMGGGLSAIALLSDGTALAGGYFSHLGNTPRAAIARVDSTGAMLSPVSSAISRSAYVRTLLPDALGRVLIGGYFHSVNGVPTPPLARLLPDGSVDPSFAFDAGFAPLVTEVMPLADGSFLVRGDGSSSGLDQPKLTRIGADGARDPSFAPNLAAEFSLAAVAAAPGGKLVLAGKIRGEGDAFSGRIFRINADGSTDATFDAANNALVDGGVTGVTVQPDGKVVVVGWFTAFGGVPCPNIVRLNPDGTVDGTFASGTGFGGGSPGRLWASVRGTVLATGYFSSYAGTAAPGFVVIQPDGRRDSFFQPARAWADSNFAPQDDGQVFAWQDGIYFLGPIGATRTYPDLVRLKHTGAADSGAVDSSFRLAGLRVTDAIHALAPGEDGSLFYSLRNTGAVHRTAPTFSPVIDTQPLPRASTVGGTTTFSVAAIAVPEPSFQWRKNDIVLDGATGTTLTLSSLKTTDAGRYDVVVTNTLGRTTSMVATLAVNPNAAPLVSLTAPAGGSTVRVGLTPPDTIAVTADASDGDGTVTQVEFFANGVVFGSATLAPFTVNFTAASIGNYALTAVATDDSGNRATSVAVSITAVSGSDPLVTLSTSAIGSTSVINAVLSLTAVATPGPGRSIASVRFLANGVQIGSPDTTFPFSATWVPTQPGIYALTAVATDDFAVTSTSAPVNIAINTGLPPTVVLTNPSPGASVVVNTPLSLSASASSNAQSVISHVRFYVNGILLATDTNFPYSITWTPTQTGTYVLTAVATDSLANAATSFAVSVTVTLPLPPAPTISTQPVGTTVVVGQTAVFTVVATDPASLTYQWRKGGTNLSGATLSTLALTDVQLSAAGTYDVAVSNPQATRLSAGALLRVLTVAECHSADYNRDARLNLAELTRVIELYNTRHGTLRTGRYSVAATPTTTADGFAPDPTASGVAATLTSYHTADANRDGRLSLTELTRVIELFGTRAGSTRTGAYHVPAAPTTTEDGFAPGP